MHQDITVDMLSNHAIGSLHPCQLMPIMAFCYGFKKLINYFTLERDQYKMTKIARSICECNDKNNKLKEQNVNHYVILTCKDRQISSNCLNILIKTSYIDILMN